MENVCYGSRAAKFAILHFLAYSYWENSKVARMRRSDSVQLGSGLES
jgi:hypothetical protein